MISRQFLADWYISAPSASVPSPPPRGPARCARHAALHSLQFLFFILLAILLTGPVGAQSRRDPQSNVICLNQVSDKRGRLRIWIDKDGVRVEKVDNGFFILCTKPNWNVFVFDPRKHVICKRTYADWIDNGLYKGLNFLGSAPVRLEPTVLHMPGRVNFQGFELVRCAIPADGQRQLDPHTAKALFLMAPAITADPHVFAFLRRLLDIQAPTTCAVIEWSSHKSGQQFMYSTAPNPERGWIKDLRTTQIEKIPYNAKDFLPPVKYKTILEDRDIVFGEKTQLEDFVP